MKRYCLKLGFVVFFVIVAYFLSLFAHEFAHYFIIQVLGGQADIVYPELTSGLVRLEVAPMGGLWLVYLSGGLFSGLLCLALWAWAHWTPTPWDLPFELAFGICGVAQIGLGIREEIVYLCGHSPLAFDILIALVIGIIVCVYLPRTLRWAWGEK